jgi:hypothetical protein
MSIILLQLLARGTRQAAALSIAPWHNSGASRVRVCFVG